MISLKRYFLVGLAWQQSHAPSFYFKGGFITTYGHKLYPFFVEIAYGETALRVVNENFGTISIDGNELEHYS